MVTSGCKDVYNEVYKRVRGEGGTDLKARAYANVAQKNCEEKGGGDPPGDNPKKK